MYVVLAIAIVLIAVLLFLLDRALKAVQRGRRRRDAAIRLGPVAAQAEQEARHRAEAADARNAITAVLPAIPKTERGPRNVA